MKILSGKQSGQAVVEYILVLLVVISILAGMMWQFNDAFRQFTQSYFGNYIACLLELGELPALGGTSSGQCEAEYKPFNIAEGKSPLGSPIGEKGPKDDSSKSDSSSSSSSSSSGGSSSTRAAESSDTFGRNYSGSSRSGRPTSVVIGTAKEDVYTGSTEASNGKQRTVSGARTVKIETVDQSGGTIDPFAERKMKGSPVSIAKVAVDDNLKSKKAKVEINRKVANSDRKDEDTKMGFGDFMRWLLIAAIIIAIVFFLGGQALQIGKNWE